MASRAILSIHCEPQETDACRRFGGVSVSISASHGRVQNSWRQAFRFIKLTSTAAYGVLGQAHSQVRVRDQLLPRFEFWRKCRPFNAEAQRSVDSRSKIFRSPRVNRAAIFRKCSGMGTK